MDDLGKRQKEFEDKVLFFNSEKILHKGNKDKKILNHFSNDHKKIFQDRMIEFCSKKG